MVKTEDPIETGRVGTAEPGFSAQESEASSSRIKRNIDQTRAEMDQTVNALAEELSPRHLLDDFLNLFRGDSGKVEVRRIAQQVGSKTLATIRRHPVPSTLVGAGLVYLLLVEEKDQDGGGRMSWRERSRSGAPDVEMSAFVDEVEAGCGCVEGEAGEYDYIGVSQGGQMDAGEGMTQQAKDKIGDAAGDLKDKAAGAVESAKQGTAKAMTKAKDTAAQAAQGVGHLASRVGAGAADKVRKVASRVSQRASDAAGRAGEAARRTGHNVRTGAAAAGHIMKEKATDMAEQVRHGYDVSKDKAAEVFDEFPLAVGAAIAGLGLLVGLTLPRTRREDEMMGEKSDVLKLRGREAIHRGIQVAQVTAEETIDEAKRQGLTAEAITDKAKRIAAELTDKATEVAQREEVTAEQLGDKVKAVAEHAKDVAKEEIKQSNLQESNV
jgi:hypothetical protein